MTRLTTLILTVTLLAAACGAAGSGDGPVDPDSPAPTLPPGVPGDKPPAKSDQIPDNAGEVFIDTADLIVMESFPIQVRVTVEGSLPTPCHGLSWVQRDDGDTIDITVFSLEPGPAVSCIAVVEPFSLSIDVGSFADEDRTVRLNGEVVGEFTS